MTAPVHNPVPVRARDGWARWSSACSCGWTAKASGREDALKRCTEHKAIVDALAWLQAQPRYTLCDCYDQATLEYAPHAPCGYCRAREALTTAAGAA